MAIASGETHPVLKIGEIDITPNGRSYTVSVDGFRPFVEQQLASFIASGAQRINYRPNGAEATITAQYAGPPPGVTEVPLDTISLKTSEQGIQLYFNKRYAGLKAQVISAVRLAVTADKTYAEKVADITQAALDAGGGAGTQGLALELFDWIIGGTDSFQVAVRTITRTRTVSKAFNTKVSQADVEKLFNPAQLTEYLGGSTLPFEVPELVATAEETTKGIVVAWRKFQCDVDDTATGQRQLVESWQLAKWTAGHYDVKA